MEYEVSRDVLAQVRAVGVYFEGRGYEEAPWSLFLPFEAIREAPVSPHSWAGCDVLRIEGANGISFSLNLEGQDARAFRRALGAAFASRGLSE